MLSPVEMLLDTGKAASFVHRLTLFVLVASSCRCDENFLTRSDVTNGQVFPATVNVYAGETVFIRIVQTVADQQHCTVRRPGGQDIDIRAAAIKDSRLSAWPANNRTSCGIRIRQVTTGDSGHWRLTSSHGDHRTRGYSFVSVDVAPITPSVHTLTTAADLITPPGARYCYVLRPDQNADNFPEHRRCTIQTESRSSNNELGVESNGLWNVIAGVDGQTDEVLFSVNVAAEAENLQTSVSFDDGKNALRLACNLRHSQKPLQFCRFVRLSDGQGFNVAAGQGVGRYSYVGSGFEAGDCGLQIAEPDAFDRFRWKCLLGYGHANAQSAVENGTIGAILDASAEPAHGVVDLKADNVYGLDGTPVNILCKSPIAVDYCWFTHPQGDRISVSDPADSPATAAIADDADDSVQRFGYYGSGLRMGECGIRLSHATLNDTGRWKCHLGTFRRIGFEASRDVSVRISTSRLVASEPDVQVLTAAPIHLECTTIPVRLPLEYCRFVRPDGRGFSIDETIDAGNALEGVYFNPNRRLIDGHCSIIVASAQLQSHAGQWTCAGRLIGRNAESSDDFTVNVIENGLSAAALSGMIIGSLLVVAVTIVIGIRGYRKRRRLSAEEPMAMTSSM